MPSNCCCFHGKSLLWGWILEFDSGPLACAEYCDLRRPMNPPAVPAAPVSTATVKKVTGLLCNPRGAQHAVLHNYGFCSWSSAAGPERKTQLSRRSRVEASVAEDGASPTGVSAGAGLTIATSMTASHSTGTSRSLWKQNKLNNKGERWHSPPFSQLHQINRPSHRARDRCWSPRRVAQWRSDKSFSIPGFPPRTWLLREFGDEAGKAPSSAVVILPSAHHTHNQ